MNYDTEIQIHKNSIGSKTKLQESLLEAVQILHDGFIVNEKIPKTLECRIADDSKKDKGIYTVDYMNNKFEVSCFLDETFNVNDIVCVLVPDGDFAKTKIIIGSSDGSGEGANWVTQEQLDQAVTTLQINFQAGVDAIGDACTRKGSPPASHSLKDTVAAIDAIQTGGNYMTKEIREDGTYYASDDGVDAYDVVVVSKDVGQPHTVVFYGPDGNIIKTQANVPYHGYASCTLLDGTIKNGLYFKGWNPHPTNIVRDTFCYPQYGDYIIESGEIEDDWETICANKGANYPIGSYKALVFDVPVWDYGRYDYKVWHGGEWVDDYTELSNPTVSVAMRMVKVAEGEDGSTSSWISTGGIYLSGVMKDNGGGNGTSGFGRRSSTHSDWYAVPDWSSSFVRKYLNEHFLSNMPQCVKDTIKEVNKSYLGMTHSMYYDRQTTQTLVEKTSIDKIWIPSRKELKTRCQGLGFDSFCENNGIDYSLIYNHTLNVDCTFRTSAPYNGNTYYIIQQECWKPSINYIDGACTRYVMFGFCL